MVQIDRFRELTINKHVELSHNLLDNEMCFNELNYYLENLIKIEEYCLANNSLKSTEENLLAIV